LPAESVLDILKNPDSLRLIERELCLRSFHQFVRKFWPIAEPRDEFVDTNIVKILCSCIQAHEEDRFTETGLSFSVPPGSGKSLIIRVLGVCWVIAREPNSRHIAASMNHSLAVRDTEKVKRVLKSDLFRSLFTPDWTFKQDQEKFFLNSKGGFLKAVTSGGSDTGGHRGDRQWIDDPNDPQRWASDREKEDIINWWGTVFSSRVTPKKYKRYMIQQRVGPKDLTGFVMKTQASEWKFIHIPAEFEPESRLVVMDKYGKLVCEDTRTQPNELFFPFTPRFLEVKKSEMSRYAYSAQYQQRPMVATGNVIDIGWMQRFNYSDLGDLTSVYDPDKAPIKLMHRFISCDPALTVKSTNDPCGLVVLGFTEVGKAYIVDDLTGRMQYHQLMDALKRLAQRWKPQYVLIESNRDPGLISELQRLTSLPVVPLFKGAGMDKLSEFLKSVEPQSRTGNVFIPETARPDTPKWVPGLEDELMAFPDPVGADHMDRCDCISQAFNFHFLGQGKGPRTSTTPVKLRW